MSVQLRTAILAAAALALSACATHEGPAYGPPTAGAGATVNMSSSWRFNPHEVSIRAGQSVEWRNTSTWSHTVTGEGFDSGDVKPGQVFSHTFAKAGRYEYICKPHKGLGMHGVVVVT
jgi:plastocyanin